MKYYVRNSKHSIKSLKALICFLWFVNIGGSAPASREGRNEKNNQECRDFYKSQEYVWEPVQNTCVPCSVCEGSKDAYCQACPQPTTTIETAPLTTSLSPSTQPTTASSDADYPGLVTATDYNGTRNTGAVGPTTDGGGDDGGRGDFAGSEQGMFFVWIVVGIAVLFLVAVCVIIVKIARMRATNKQRVGKPHTVEPLPEEIPLATPDNPQAPPALVLEEMSIPTQETQPALSHHPMESDISSSLGSSRFHSDSETITIEESNAE